MAQHFHVFQFRILLYRVTYIANKFAHFSIDDICFRFIPSFFEKKQYYNAPLSSLKSLTIRINNPDGALLNTQNDLLKIHAIESEEIDNQEITATKGFPNTDNSDAHNKYIKITTVNNFFNKQFKIGDRIKLIGVVVTTNSTLQTFLNRNFTRQ